MTLRNALIDRIIEMQLSDVLKNIRDESGKTQQQMADRIGVTKRSYISYEKGDTKISLDNFFILAVYCQFDIVRMITLQPRFAYLKNLKSSIKHIGNIKKTT